MLKRMLKPIRKQLLKSDRFKHILTDYRTRLEEQRQKESRVRLMLSGYTVRNVIPQKLRPYDTLVVLTDDGVFTERMNGRIVGHWVPAINPQGGSNAAEDSKGFRTYDNHGSLSGGLSYANEQIKASSGKTLADIYPNPFTDICHGPCTSEQC